MELGLDTLRENMELLPAVEVITQIVTYAMLASGIPPCWHIAVAGIFYGILVSNTSLRNINIIGVGFNLAYIVAFLAVCRSKSTPLIQIFTGAAVVFIFFWYLSHIVIERSAVINNLGMFLFMDCIREQSTEGMSLSMLYGGLLCSSTWLVYGMLLKDFYIYAPNIIGVSTSMGKLIALLVYGGKKKDQKTK
ncbi:hypothetical protein KUTeg_017835 [Tegillarca granosa]|uniref:Sugar transporter SWEET1 n=1 Tax=Tegillarca granosa TaxID=220873 RepID=A0ABQ9EG31_TEGGR|nr:hypothetical protein KUTeg_017835 [Tegillarca granosa]